MHITTYTVLNLMVRYVSMRIVLRLANVFLPECTEYSCNSQLLSKDNFTDQASNVSYLLLLTQGAFFWKQCSNISKDVRFYSDVGSVCAASSNDTLE